jgi:hypothetical protein
MRSKDFPAALIERMRSRYHGPEAMSRMRHAANDYALATFGLTEEQLVCMVYSPFAEKGTGLLEFLEREHPALADRIDAVHLLLADETRDDPAPAAALERMSGLELRQLRVLYRSSVRGPDGAGTDVIDAVLAGDPHKAVIRTRRAKHGPDTLEQISGR